MNRISERIPRPAKAGLQGQRASIKIRLKVLTVESRPGRDCRVLPCGDVYI